EKLGDIRLLKSPEQTRQSLLRVTPIGTNLQSAKLKLTSSRFRCTDEASGKYWGRPEQPPYVYGSLRKTIGIATDREWQVALFYTNGAVSDILVRVRVVTY